MTEKQDIYNEDWGDAEEETKAAASSKLFVKLKNDGDEVYVAFIQKPQTREVRTKQWGMAARTKANVAVFDDRGFIGTKILELAPTHWVTFMEYRKKYGGDTVFQIKRKGPAGDKDTKYIVFYIRKLKEDEKEPIAVATRHDLWVEGREEDADGYPGSFRPEALTRDAFAAAAKVQMSRIGWDKSSYMKAVTIFFGRFKEFADMTPVEREDIIVTMEKLPSGAAPETCVREPLDLAEETDFF